MSFMSLRLQGRVRRAACFAIGALGTAMAHAEHRCDTPDASPADVVPADVATASSGTIKPIKGTWGSATWREPSRNCKLIGQTYEFWPAQAGTGPRPTIVYFHALYASSHVGPNSPVWNNLVAPAMAAGFNVVTPEFRHPVIDEYLADYDGGTIYQNDAGLVLQYLRTNAKALNISTNNIFSFGHSLGTLALWQALQPDLGGGSTGQPSSLPTAFFGYNAQSTYKCAEFKQLFLLSDKDSRNMVANCQASNPYYQQFGSAVDSVTADSPPVHLQYAQAFMLEPGTDDVVQRITLAEFNALGYNDVHYPDYGIALLSAYLAIGNTRMDYPEQNVSKADQFKGWQAFVMPLVVADQP